MLGPRSGRALRSAVPDGRATPPAPFSYTAGFHQPISHTASAGGTGYLTIFQEISSGPLSVSVDGAGPVILTDGEINYGLISPGAHTITATSGPETVASGSVVVPAGQRLTAVIHLAPGGVPTVTGFDNDRSVPPLANLSWSFVTPPMRHRLTSTSAGRWWLQTWPTIPPARRRRRPVTIAVAEAVAPASQVLAVQHRVLAAGDLIDVFVVGISAAHPSTVGLITDTIQLGAGYRLYASDGGAFDFGDANYFGSTAGLHLSETVIGAALTSGGDGYWMDATDRGVFSFGDASIFGSAAGLHLNNPSWAWPRTPTRPATGWWPVTEASFSPGTLDSAARPVVSD